MENISQKVVFCRRHMIAMLLLNFSDWLSTVVITRYDGFYEVNPIMQSMLQNPLLCFILKCIVPFIFVLYIYCLLPSGGETIIKFVSVTIFSVLVFYFMINIVHIINFTLLLYS
ncbi:MAG: hypothetical protein IJV39_06480 [Ruminococcus sp.]|nr:hypothetical protein [Ruminococcus sp.]